jgi:hypothetical protein
MRSPPASLQQQQQQEWREEQQQEEQPGAPSPKQRKRRRGATLGRSSNKGDFMSAHLQEGLLPNKQQLKKNKLMLGQTATTGGEGSEDPISPDHSPQGSGLNPIRVAPPCVSAPRAARMPMRNAARIVLMAFAPMAGANGGEFEFAPSAHAVTRLVTVASATSAQKTTSTTATTGGLAVPRRRTWLRGRPPA